MSKKNEDSVERFFRKAARQYDNSFRASDWQKLEKMLDEKAAETTVLRTRTLKRTVLSLAGGAIIFVAIYFLAFDNDGIAVAEAGLTKGMQAAAGRESPQQVESQKKIPAADLLSSDQTSGTRNNESATLNGTAGKKTPDSGEALPMPDENISVNISSDTGVELNNKTGLHRKSRALLSQSHFGSVTESRQSVIAQNPLTSQLPTNSQPLPSDDPQRVFPLQQRAIVSDDKTNNTNQSSEEIHPITTEAKAETADKEPDLVVTAPVENIPVTAEKTKENPANEKQALIPSRWNLAIVVAPDFSTTALSRYTAPGGAYGILFGYRILNRLTASTGILRSTKKYEGYGAEYKPPAGYWQRRTNGVIPDYIKGICEIVEIPVVFQYDLKQSDKFRVFISGGVSSYLMLSEKYAYTFENPNPGAAKGWSSPNSTSYFMSIGHLSAAYERQLTQRLAIGVEPFLKIPLAEIGWSNIDLFTTGAYLNLRYRILKKSAF